MTLIQSQATPRSSVESPALPKPYSPPEIFGILRLAAYLGIAGGVLFLFFGLLAGDDGWTNVFTSLGLIGSSVSIFALAEIIHQASRTAHEAKTIREMIQHLMEKPGDEL